MKYYAKSHEYVIVDGTNATVGISIHAAEELGDVTYVELPEEGEVSKGDSVSVVESVKAASDIYTPISGNIVELNEILEDEPEKVNADAEGEGWIFKLEGINADELSELMTEEQYKEFLG